MIEHARTSVIANRAMNKRRKLLAVASTKESFAARDLDILETLARRVPLMALTQIVRVWWPNSTSPRATRRRLARLVRAGWLGHAWINAHPLLPARKPLAVWRPGEEEPDAERVADLARRRWSKSAEPMSVYFVSARTANWLASSARGLSAPEHRDHDLRLAEVYVRYRLRFPRLAACWLGEHALPKAGYQLKDPDAFLIDAAGQPFRVIESAGRYRPAQVEAFHEHCREFELPYELW